MKFFCICVFLLLFQSQLAAQPCADSKQCIEPNKWELGLAVGVGAKLNPLQGGDHIPLLVLPDIAWYGESFYFDNGELGWQWQSSPSFLAEVYAAPNSERAYFSFLHPANIFSPANLTQGVPISEVDSREQFGPAAAVNIDDIAKRKWAFDAGVRFHIMQEHGQWRFSATSDVSGVHHGQQLSISYQRHTEMNSWHITYAGGVAWKSAKLLNYYYGLGDKDNLPDEQHYQAKSGIFPSVSILLNKPINDNWDWLMRLQVEHLPSGMANSPIVNKKMAGSVFAGAAYRF